MSSPISSHRASLRRVEELNRELEVAFLKWRLMGEGAKDLLKREGVSDINEFWNRMIAPLQERISEAEQKLKCASL